MNLKKQLDRLCGNDSGYWSQRLHSEVDYLLELLAVQPGVSADTVQAVLSELTQRKQENGALTKQDVLLAEEKLSCYHPLARQYKLRMISHAHIDMNWQWGFEETVGVVIDTFRTMLRLLEEYPQFIFTQSQASVYEIVEKYAPDLLPAIRRHVKDGRWEVIASTWVEADKNMINAESMSRHILYTKQYLQQLLGLTPEQLQLDFEPDTFGHSANVPEILCGGGIRYYYHCRGFDGEQVYRWRAPSGAEVLTLRDPEWYMLIDMDYHMINHVPRFCTKNHTKTAVRFYGVGDHGGGPSRRDIERILDMQTWPLAPEICFSTLHDVFRDLEQSRDLLPVVEQELNYIFTGCYSSQAQIKHANRHGEDHLYDCEALCAMAKAMGCDLSGMPDFDSAWKKILFNQFHDILPGSGVRETREHALGIAQEANAVCVANANRALHAMGQKISTDLFPCEQDNDCAADSAGSGFNTTRRSFCATRFNIGSAGKSTGPVRPFTIFNPAQYDREEMVEITVWDWPEPLEATEIRDSDGQECPFHVKTTEGKYWQHTFCRLAFVAKVPAFGYANYYVTEADRPANRIPIKGAAGNNRVHTMNDGPIVMENDHIRAVFNRCTMELTSLWDKKTQTELLRAPGAGFRLNEEQDHPRMSAWILSPIGRSENLNQSCFVKIADEQTGGLYQQVNFDIRFRSSQLHCKVSLSPTDRSLRFSLMVDWNERAVPGEFTPQLQFCAPFAYHAEKVRYDIPAGCIDRPQLAHDVPAIGYAAPLPTGNAAGLVLTTDCKYGYRTYNDDLCVTLFHSGYTPDKQPDTGVHYIELGLGAADDLSRDALSEYAFRFAHPLYCYCNTPHPGTLPQQGQLLRVDGVKVEAVKLAESGNSLIVRLSANSELDTHARVFCANAAEACQTDLLEAPIQTLNCSDQTVDADIPAGALRTLRICLNQ